MTSLTAKHLRSQEGFTLIELAIVLVVIALITGGILAGRELITSARIQDSVGKVADVEAALAMYEQRRSALPGDDNGDGSLSGSWTDAGGEDTETEQFWTDLRENDMLNLDTEGSDPRPTYPMGSRIGVQDGNLGMTGLVMCYDDADAEFAQTLDSQRDDGSPDSGNVRALDETGQDGSDTASDFDWSGSGTVCVKLT